MLVLKDMIRQEKGLIMGTILIAIALVITVIMMFPGEAEVLSIIQSIKDLEMMKAFLRAEYGDNAAYRILNAYTPGPYTFILQASREVPRRLLHPKRRTIGLRVPDNRICQALLAELNEPLMSSTLILPGEHMPMTDPYKIRDLLEHQLDLVIDGGYCDIEPTTVVDMTGDRPVVTRVGKGDPAPFAD